MPRGTRELIDRLMEGGLDEYVSARRSEGLSFSSIAVRIGREFDIDVTGETVRAWFRESAASPPVFCVCVEGPLDASAVDGCQRCGRIPESLVRSVSHDPLVADDSPAEGVQRASGSVDPERTLPRRSVA